MCKRTPFSLACFGIALCMPASVVAQAIAVPSPSRQTVQDSPTVTPEMTKRLDGRLFYSAQERQRLNNARKRGPIVGDTGSPMETPPSVLNGFVKRSDGNTAVWVDGDVRWNSSTRIVGSLSPGDVGGPPVYLKSTSGEAKALVPKPVATNKKTIKPHARNRATPRLLP